MSSNKGSRLSDALPDLVNSIIDKAAGIAALSLGATALYFLYALFAGFVRAYPQLAYVQRVRVRGNLETASTIFLVAALVLVAYTVVRLWEEQQLPAWLGLTGVLLHFGSPFALAQILGVSFANNNAAFIIQRALTNAGMVVLAAAIIRGIPALCSQLLTGLTGFGEDSATRRVAKKQGGGLVHPLSPCWCLPYCRPYIRDKCVRYKDKKACWRKKSGCMCDDSIMAAALMGGENTSAGAREKLMLEFLPGAGTKTTVQRRLKCRNCFIFLEHQRIKHKYAAPLALPATVGAFWYFNSAIESMYQGFGLWATHMVQKIALGQINTRVFTESFTNPIVKWLILFCVGMYLLTYVLRFLEYVFFKLKI